MITDYDMTVALLLSCDSFESFFGTVLKLDRDQYLNHYRNDFSWYYSMGLLRNGVRPILYIPSLQHDGFYETDVGVSVRFLRLAGWYRPFATLRRAMRATRFSLYLHERVNAAAFSRQMHKVITADNVDLLYVQEYWGGRFDHLVARTPVPLVAADHGGLAKGVVKWFKRRSFQQAVLLYCQTQDECQDVQHYCGRTKLHPNGGDTTFFIPVSNDRTKNILTVSRLTNKQKRTSDLIKALVRLPNDWTLDIVGTGPDERMLESLADDLGVRSRVIFHGFRTRSEVRLLLQSCGVYAMPSANEAVCLAVLEAMSCGAAVVGSRIRAFQSMITDGKNGKLFPVGDIIALAKAIAEAWSERSILGPAATKFVSENFNSTILDRELAESMRKIAGISKPMIRNEAQPLGRKCASL